MNQLGNHLWLNRQDNFRNRLTGFMGKKSGVFFSVTGIFVACLAASAQSPAPSPPPTTSVQIVNATSVPNIVLKINDKTVYPNFPTANYTGDAPIKTLTAVYVAENKMGGEAAKSQSISYEPNTNQSLVIIGDFGTKAPPGTLLQPDSSPLDPGKPFPPSVLFQVFSHAVERGDQPVRLRIINGMPGKRLKFTASQKSLEILPGFNEVITGQSPIASYSAEIDGETLPVQLHQVSLIRNGLVVFYLKDGKPAFTRAFENTKSSREKLEKAQSENQ